MDYRFNEDHLRSWHETGFAIIENFFVPDEIAPVLEDFETLYGQVREADGVGRELNLKQDDQVGSFSRDQFKHFDNLPYPASPAINLISLHPELIRLAQALLGVPAVHCYQSHTWAKFTGVADYDQDFHCDFGNHTLVVPSEAASLRTVNFVIYVSDVTDDLGALHYVTHADRETVLGKGALQPQPEQQTALKALQRSAAAPAGSLLIYGIDALHRGTNLTRANGHRFTMSTSYKAAGNDQIGFHVWQFAPDRAWHQVMNHASPEQLAVLGIPAPGHSFWTPQTLALTQQRWPDWDMQVYFDAAG